jgi:hypothetical protein
MRNVLHEGDFPLQEGYELLVEIPKVPDYIRLRAAAGLSPKSIEAAVAGLPNTWFGVVIKKDNRAVGMAGS